MGLALLALSLTILGGPVGFYLGRALYVFASRDER